MRPIPTYQVSLANDLAGTLPYLGATAVQNSGSTGQGIRVAMLDTGIDYTHYNLGGSGNIADYKIAAAAAATTPPAGLFPTSKVIGGYDFVGEVWPNGPQGAAGPLAPDPNPIDLAGHGSRTADIVAGHSRDGVHLGTAPNAQLYAVKVCSSVSSACSGVAILEGLDYALDPNNTGTLNNAVDVISMSIGSDFGLREEDDGEAFTDIVNFGVVGVVAAGNAGDVPYVVGGPAVTPEVIALAATQGVASVDVPLEINQPASLKGLYGNTATLAFAPITSPVTGNVVYVGRGCPATATTPADPYPAGNLSGNIFLIDRGSCAVSLKIDRAARAGAKAVLLGLVAPGDAVSFSFGGGTEFVPTLVITQALSNNIKAALKSTTVNVTLSLANTFSLAGNMAPYSSRGPSFSYNMLKPDLSAPGTIIAALVGTGNGQSSEDGTSFATPLGAGSAALLLSKNRSLTPLDVKALLMGNADPTVFENQATEPGVLAPMTRMGAGELRVDRAAASTTAAWDASNPLSVSLSFGTYRLNTNQTFKKKVVVHNYSDTPRTYSIGNVYRDAPNQAGFTLSTPSSISVPANGASSFTLTATANATSLPIWTLNGGSNGGNGELLNTVEYAGYLTFTSGSENIHLPWHILPHKAADVRPASTSVALNGKPANLLLSNAPAPVGGLVDVFSLTGTGTQFPSSIQPGPGADYVVVNLQAVGTRLLCLDNTCSTLGVQFAINTFGQRSHPDVPAEFDVFIDVNNDGIPDYDVYNEDFGTATGAPYPSGQNAVFVLDLATGKANAYYLAIADLDSTNMIFTAPLSAFASKGLPLNYNTPFTFAVNAYDNYFTGQQTDSIGPMKYELDMPQYYAASDEFTVPANGSSALTIVPNNAANYYFTGPYNGHSPSQKGLLLMYTDGKNGQEQSSILVAP